MSILKKKTLEIFLGNKICGINEEFTALQSVFYFRFDSKCIPKKDFIGCPNATLVWALKQSRLIDNGSYAEREILIYGSGIVIVLSINKRNTLKMDFFKNNNKVFTYTGSYLSILNTLLDAAERSISISKGYDFSTMAEHVIGNEIRLMKKHIEKVRYSKT